MTKNILLCCTLIVPLLALNACSQQAIPNSGSANTSNNTQNSTAVPGQNLNAPGFENSPLVAPPSFDQRPLQPGQSPPPQTLPNGLPALKPLKGVNVDKLFSENISDTNRRFDRLENAVVDMRREFEAVKPAIVRLVAVEEDIQQMVEQLEAIASQEQYTAAPPPAPVLVEPIEPEPDLSSTDLQTPKPAPPPVAIPTPAAQTQPTATQQTGNTNGTVVKNLRTGLHSNKVRLVLDMSAKTPYNLDLDSSENILIIELPQAGWNDTRSKTFGANEALLASYNVETMNEGKGTRIIIPLKKSTTILEQAILPPSDNPNFRLYIDLSL